jgi:hypothetical protein
LLPRILKPCSEYPEGESQKISRPKETLAAESSVELAVEGTSFHLNGSLMMFEAAGS